MQYDKYPGDRPGFDEAELVLEDLSEVQAARQALDMMQTERTASVIADAQPALAEAVASGDPTAIITAYASMQGSVEACSHDVLAERLSNQASELFGTSPDERGAVVHYNEDAETILKALEHLADSSRPGYDPDKAAEARHMLAQIGRKPVEEIVELQEPLPTTTNSNSRRSTIAGVLTGAVRLAAVRLFSVGLQ